MLVVYVLLGLGALFLLVVLWSALWVSSRTDEEWVLGPESERSHPAQRDRKPRDRRRRACLTRGAR